MSTQVLVICPVRPDEHPFFLDCLDKFQVAFPVHNPGFTFRWATTQSEYRDGRSRLGAIAAARNALLDANLREEDDYVLVMDSDIVSVPFNAVTRMAIQNHDGITAPEVLIEGTESFYDTAGFLEDGRRVMRDRPYFTQEGTLVSLDCVGTMYLAPAALFQDGVRYCDEPAGLTDHEEVCAAARDRGMRVACMTTIQAYHADLPLYGIPWR